MPAERFVDEAAFHRRQRVDIQFSADLVRQMVGYEILGHLQVGKGKAKQTVVGVEHALFHGLSIARMFPKLNE